MSTLSYRVARERRRSCERRVRVAKLSAVAFTAVIALPTLDAPLSSPTAEAQSRASDTLLLARICVHESGWDSPLDCAAIHQVLVAGAAREDMSYRSYAYSYSGRALRGETSRSWVAHLREDGREPENWPRTVVVRRGGELVVQPHASWAAFRDRWLVTLETARMVMSGALSHSCETPPHDWGGRVDRARARRLGLIPVECGETRNDFYLRPALVPAPEAPATPSL